MLPTLPTDRGILLTPSDPVKLKSNQIMNARRFPFRLQTPLSIGRAGAGSLTLTLCLFLIVAPCKSLAHDPGLSTGQVRILPERIEAELTFAQGDLEAVVPLDTNGDGKISPVEMATARPALEKLGNEMLALRVEDRLVAPKSTTFRLDETNNLHITRTFPARKPGTLSVQSTLIPRLPRGHRQLVTVLDPTGSVVTEALLSAEKDVINLSLEKRSEQATPLDRNIIQGFLKLGIEHIVTGYDHLLFLFALLMIAPGLRQAALIITSFTVAHSITLGLATLNVVNFPSRYVEPLIAATIVYVGVENLVRRGGPRMRWLLTFVFGLIHGFGFAGVLRESGVTSDTTGITMPLLSFNLGVEAGQIAIAAVLLPAIWWARTTPVALRCAVPVGSSLVIILGGWWLLERTIL